MVSSFTCVMFGFPFLLLVFTGFHLDFPSFTGFYWVSLGFAGL